ncbi:MULTISPECIES: ATP-binding protein [Oceanospirillaceae]|uniref:histidine kinase n=1 Tax=Oceanobacter antarcticus TaxID=3133425 RepID=A0ABW8NCZ1_9GAMM|tara:strand:- start:2134 stop:5055 length:2922 start_codon:yes stop_codon:yes gene_type:complete
MTFSLSLLCLILLGYLALLYLSAYAVERSWIPRRWVQQPIIYLLSLGVFASAWGYYGSVALAQLYGYGYFSYFGGLAGAFLLTPILLRPILRITRRYQLNSLADLLAFRYRSQAAGVLVSICMLCVVVPLLSLQIKAVADTLDILSPGWPVSNLALGFAMILLTLTIMFGARQMTPRENHEGLVFSLALESLFKLVAAAVTTIVVVTEIIPASPGGDQWMLSIHHYLASRPSGPPDGPWLTLLVMCLAIAIAMPHTFHITFTENVSNRALRLASWAFPLILLALSLSIPPLLWAGMSHQITVPTEYFALGLGLETGSPTITLLVFLGGVAAATGVSIQMTLATTAMLLNHLLFPHYKPSPKHDFYRWLLWSRRLLILGLIALSYLFYQLMGDKLDINRLGILACGAAMQFLPGILGLLYWRGASRTGFVAGLSTGLAIWLLGLLLPLLLVGSRWEHWFMIPDESNWHRTALLSVLGNLLLFVIISFTRKPDDAELSAADACVIAAQRPSMQLLEAENSNDAILALSRPLGRYMAEREVHQALTDLGLPGYEDRPHELRRLRVRLEANLSALLGPTVAQDIIRRYLPLQEGTELSSDIYIIEQRLEGFHDRLSGIAGELDHLRRYHRQTLERLPIGACSLAEDGEILLWNQVMVELTGLAAERVTGTLLHQLPTPWGDLLGRFIKTPTLHEHKKRVDIGARPRWYTLHKSIIQSANGQPGGIVLLLEDQTDTQLLERELIHSERLASIGRLAAGVAHEIGNPITGIDCLAQSMEYETDNPELHQIAHQIREQTQRVSRILQSMMNFAHAGNHATENEEVNLHHCLEDAMQLLRLNKRSPDIEFVNQSDPELLVIGDSQRLVQVFINLLSNARDASQPGQQVIADTLADMHQVTVRVTDQGHGIPPDTLEQVFEPFFTTKEVGKGTGLGLALVYSIIEEHYGQVQIVSPVTGNAGTCVKVSLPRYLPENRMETNL